MNQRSVRRLLAALKLETIKPQFMLIQNEEHVKEDMQTEGLKFQGHV